MIQGYIQYPNLWKAGRHYHHRHSALANPSKGQDNWNHGHIIISWIPNHILDVVLGKGDRAVIKTDDVSVLTKSKSPIVEGYSESKQREDDYLIYSSYNP